MRVSGSIVGELSTKIPSNTFAINELIKNAYDAFSLNVTISVSKEKKEVTITDDGNGMDEDDIKQLLHIARSSKQFGSYLEGKNYNDQVANNKKSIVLKRHCQGSKGLGFLSALKFGDKIFWETTKDGVTSDFIIDRDNLLAADDLTEVEVDVRSKKTEKKSGTTIIIRSNPDDIELILESYSDAASRYKTVGAIDDNNFNISLDIDCCYEKVKDGVNKKKSKRVTLTSKDIKNPEDEAPDSQIFFAKGLTDKSQFEIYNDGHFLEGFDFKLSRNDYTIVFELAIFKFSAYGTKSVSDFYKKEENGKLFPVLYVNDNVFNNFTIFDPEVNRSKKTEDVLAQIVGKVKIYTQSGLLDFNSDRTNFVENSFTKTLTKDLETLNSVIQSKASQLKRKRNRIGKPIKKGRAYPKGGTPSEKKAEPATIILSRRSTNIHIPSNQISLLDFVQEVINSNGETVDKNKLKVRVNGKEYNNPILESQNSENSIAIQFEYEDNNTGLAIKEVVLTFKPPKTSIKGVDDTQYFEFPFKNEYQVTLPNASKLIEEISTIQRKFPNKYNAMTACSLRAIIELSVDKMKEDFSHIFTQKPPTPNKYKGDEIAWDVAQLINFIKKNPNVRTEITKYLDFVGYKTFGNLLSIDSFFDAVKGCHVGAHKSNKLLPDSDIKSLAFKAGLICIICDVLIYKADKGSVNSASVPAFTHS